MCIFWGPPPAGWPEIAELCAGSGPPEVGASQGDAPSQALLASSSCGVSCTPPVLPPWPHPSVCPVCPRLLLRTPRSSETPSPLGLATSTETEASVTARREPPVRGPRACSPSPPRPRPLPPHPYSRNSSAGPDPRSRGMSLRAWSGLVPLTSRPGSPLPRGGVSVSGAEGTAGFPSRDRAARAESCSGGGRPV